MQITAIQTQILLPALETFLTLIKGFNGDEFSRSDLHGENSNFALSLHDSGQHRNYHGQNVKSSKSF